MASLTKLIFWWLSCSDEPSATARTTRVPCNPETGVGVLAAVAEPASSYLRVVNRPVRTGKHGIMTMTPELCCNGVCSNVYCCGTLDATAARFSRHSWCSLCSYRLDGARVVYMCKGLPFCTRGCRFDHFMVALYDKRHWELTGRPLGNRIAAADDVRTWLVPKEEEEFFRKIFFCRR